MAPVALVSRRQTLQRNEAHASPVAAVAYPVLTLPFDIISSIFVYCLPPEDDALPWRTEAPLLLAGICRDWRDIALATHDLWNTLHLSLRPYSILKVASLLEFWIPRAGNLPLSISLVCKCGNDLKPGSADSAWLDALAELIAQYAPHWSTVELHIPFPALIRLSPPREDFTSLKKLVLNSASWPGGKIPARVFSKSPKLRELHIRELHIISGARTRVALPWEQLTTLRLDNTSTEECVKTLAFVPNLVHFTSTLWSLADFVPQYCLFPVSNIWH
ncbi:hypothetical protein B0H13DRAFT_364587 [Mycena leptocephala]|nr:hypothetical protein B0H13DRAFT_364587 [Mycena leptocephala]